MRTAGKEEMAAGAKPQTTNHLSDHIWKMVQILTTLPSCPELLGTKARNACHQGYFKVTNLTHE